MLLLFNCDKAILKYENVLEEQEHTEVRDIKSQENVKNCFKCFI